MKYAAVRNCLLRKGRNVEIVANYEPALHYVGEWWKQLFGESEGKDNKGIFPAACDLLQIYIHLDSSFRTEQE